ncbi:MAG: ferritin [Anaerolineae bacterium]|nr:ferritin [Anaerolineae bacterium]
MELSKNLEDAINEQIQAELYSAYMYLSMSAYFESLNLPGFAHWMRVQTHEEMEHAMKFYHYVFERGGRVTLCAIQQPPAEFESALDVAEKTYAHEQHVTSLIYKLYELALAEKDHATAAFLQWYINEQVEEENNARTIVEQLKMVGDRVHGLLMLDHQLGGRGED